RPCLIPDPHVLDPSCTPPTGPAIPNCVVIPSAGTNSTQMLSVSASLVRLASTRGAPVPASYVWGVPPGSPPNAPPLAYAKAPAPPAAWWGAGTVFHIGTLFGPGHPAPPAFTPTPDATNCDLDNSGKVIRTDP